MGRGASEMVGSVGEDGDTTATTYGVTHVKSNVSNFLWRKRQEHGIWLFDFDQFQMNYFIGRCGGGVMFGVYFFDKMDYGGVKACRLDRKMESFKDSLSGGISK